VLTQTQLERLLHEVPARTLRYRTERLTKLGLVGRSRPYRDRGSAPFHYWPTRASDAFVRGEPAPRGGERTEPNPQFLHHAERLSELYVLLAVQAPTVGLRLHAFQREGDAREVFRADGRERALAPDALVHLKDEDGRGLLAFLELDMGTMSHARLKTKAAGYAAYASQAAWTERHAFCPCLLFLTTTEARALAFLKILTAQLDRQGRGNYYSRRYYFEWFAAAACDHAADPERALVEACWDDLALAGGGLTLTDCLNKARVPYDSRRVKEEAEERAREATRERLRTRPEALRTHLMEKHVRLHAHLDQFGAAGAAALDLLLASREDMSEMERDAFAAIVRQLDTEDPLEVHAKPEPVPPTVPDLDAVELLAENYRRRQRAQVEELARRYGVGPQLRRYGQMLDRGELLSTYNVDGLQAAAKRDQDARRDQERLRDAYLERRDQEARGRKHQLGLATRIAHGPAALHSVIDRERLRACRRCDEISYPDGLGRDRYGTSVYKSAERCHFCRGSDLAAWNPAYQTQLEHGPEAGPYPTEELEA
jgi:Replication-relaxation